MINNGKVLLFHVESQKEKQIRDLCKKLNIHMVVIPKEQYGEILGALAGISGMKLSKIDYKGCEFSQEMMVISGLDSDHLDIFLEKYREEKIAPIALKATLTPYNVMWSADSLYEELRKECLHFNTLHKQ